MARRRVVCGLAAVLVSALTAAVAGSAAAPAPVDAPATADICRAGTTRHAAFAAPRGAAGAREGDRGPAP